jgi:hypothetical protein
MTVSNAFGDQQCDRLDFRHRSGGIGQFRLHDRECPGLAKHVDQVGRQGLGDDDHRTKLRHYVTQNEGRARSS